MGLDDQLTAKEQAVSQQQEKLRRQYENIPVPVLLYFAKLESDPRYAWARLMNWYYLSQCSGEFSYEAAIEYSWLNAYHQRAILMEMDSSHKNLQAFSFRPFPAENLPEPLLRYQY